MYQESQSFREPFSSFAGLTWYGQRHVGAAIFYNIWRYYQTTGDFEFLLEHGAEMLLNISYSEPRTSHGSTLSYVVHAAVLADLDAQRSWEMFMRALVPEVLTISIPP